ncbi:MAG TPA: response regulator [Ktedonobacterales bacterium]|nr:response regulator [Ktedonobacterales bacterium]
MSSFIPQTASDPRGYEPVYPETEARTRFTDDGEPTVMVIDDSVAVRTILEASFHRVGVRVHSFRDGISAIQALSKGTAPVPAVLLLDLNLPRMDGYEVAHILRGNTQFNETIILVLTGKDGIVDRMKCRWIGAREFIKKPFRVSDVVRIVGRYFPANMPGFSGASDTRPAGPRG